MPLLIIKFLFIIPILLDLFIFLGQLAVLFRWEFLWSFNISPGFFIVSLLSTILLYIFFVLYNFLNLFKVNNKLSRFVRSIYLKNEKIILTAIILTTSTIVPFFISIFYPFILEAVGYLYSSHLLILVKLILILVMLLVIKFGQGLIIRAFSTVFVSLVLGMLIFFFIQIYDEFLPNYYFTFPLDDQKGRYLINYDGDYWLTYYKVQENCVTSSVEKTNCSEVLIKQGNTSITESPVELEQFVGKPVLIKGEFTKIYGSLGSDQKEFCIGRGWSKKCVVSPGPGIWHASPLKIYSITILGE